MKTKAATLALVIRRDTPSGAPLLVEAISDDQEIALLEGAVEVGESNPLQAVLDFRTRNEKEDEAFGNYVEELLSQPFVRPEIQEHGVQWLKSKIRIEEYQQTEAQAAKVIADFALKVYQEDPSRNDFTLAGPSAHVRVRVYVVGDEAAKKPGKAA